MALKSVIWPVLVALALARMQPLRSGLDRANFDPTVRPQDDLSRAATGGSLSRTPVPPDRVTYGTYAELADKTDADLRAIFARAAAIGSVSVAACGRLPTCTRASWIKGVRMS